MPAVTVLVLCLESGGRTCVEFLCVCSCVCGVSCVLDVVVVDL